MAHPGQGGPPGPMMGYGAPGYPHSPPLGPGMGMMSMHDQAESARKMQDYEALCQIINQWNANRLDLFALSLPNEYLEFHGVMRFYYQSADMGSGQKVATKCIRVVSTATTRDIIETLIEKFRPDMKMLEVPEYALYEIHESGERKLGQEEKPLLVQLNWHKDDREGRFLLRRMDEPTTSQMQQQQQPNNNLVGQGTENDPSFKRKLSKREKKEMKKAEKAEKAKAAAEAKHKDNKENNKEGVAEKLYTELPDTSFTRSISNPEAVMRRRRQQKLEKKLQQFRSRDGGPDTGGTLKIYGEALCKDVPYKTLLLSVRDSAAFVVEEMLEKYSMERKDCIHFCLVQVTTSSQQQDNMPNREYYLEEDECPLAILMNHPKSRGTVTFHVRRKPADYHPRKRKKKPMMKDFASESALMTEDRLPLFIELNVDGSDIQTRLPQRFRLSPNVTEIGSDPAISSNGGQSLLLPPAPFLHPRHCVVAHTEPGIVTVTPSHPDAETYVNGQRIFETTILTHGCAVRFGRNQCFRFVDPIHEERERMRYQASSVTLPDPHANYAYFGPPRQPPTVGQQGRDNILPAVLEFREETEDAFFEAITVGLEVNGVQFKLAPTYTIYMATRFRASTHYRPELIPEERAIRLTEMLNAVAECVYATVQGHSGDPSLLAFWMANASELLHFLKSDRHITAFSLQAQDFLAETVHIAFKFLVTCLQADLELDMPGMLADNDDDDAGTAGIMQVLGSAMSLLRKCRVNAALTIQLFSQLFHFINMWTFNQIMSPTPTGGPSNKTMNYCNHRWGLRIKKRMARVEQWAEKQGLELAADCHLARVVQAAHLLLARKNTAEDIASVSSICFKLNSLQLKTLLNRYEPAPDEKPISREMIDTIVRVAENTVDEVTNQEGREIRLEEDFVLQLPFLLPEDGYSCDIVRGVPGGLSEFLAPLQMAGLCVMTPQPTSSGFWTIYMDSPMQPPSTPVPRSPSELSQATINGGEMHPAQLQHMQMQHRQLPPPQNEPEVQAIQLVKSNGGMGLSIVAAKGVGKDKLGIYIKAVVEGGAAYHDGRLQAGDQLLKVDGQSLVGITQERAAEIMMHTGQVVELEVAKQGAIYHGLATLLAQPSPVMSPRGPPPALSRPAVPQSRSVPALHQEAAQQHLYQNHRPPLMRPPPPQQGGRSVSIQNLHRGDPPPTSHMGQRQASNPALMNGHGQPRPPQFSPEDQGFYQNVGPNGHAIPNLQQHMPLRYGNGPPNGPRFGSQTSLTQPAMPHSSPMGRYPGPGEVLHHASPRIVGTPMSSAGGPPSRLVGMPKQLTPSGPEKPQRQYSYEEQRPVNNGRGQPGNTNSQQQGRGVRFQEEPKGAHQWQQGGNNASDLAGVNSHMEQLRLSSVEREFRKRIAEYSRSDSQDSGGSDGDSGRPSKLEHLRRLEAKQQELDDAKRAEDRILLEARKRNGSSPPNGGGDLPPPLPAVPPPDQTPPGVQRLDALIGGGPSVGVGGAKKVSFSTPSSKKYDDNANINEEKISRLERAEKDPNAFINEAESLLNSSSMALEKFDFNKSTGHTPSVIGAQEVYRDPRMKRMAQKAEEEKATKTNNRDGAKLSFKEKMELFASEVGENAPRDKAKISKAQREIDSPQSEGEEGQQSPPGEEAN